ncbi:MAG TPA: YbaK/EbsC family protein [Gaiellaceae bacterium]|jgi:prolyl-tRNA editing enzyme YbaK/EbsC (Cys-tRNA(Pro) deacylase)
MESWPPEVERVASFLRMAAVDARLEEFSVGTPTAVEAAEAIGCDLSQIVKSLVFVCDGKFVLALVPGDRRADEAKVAGAVGAVSARVARPDEVRRATGFEPGAVAPFPRTEVDRVLLDRLLLGHEVVWTGAGSSRHMASITPGDLLRLARAEQADLV